MLTDSDRKWLKARKNLCIRCSKRKYCRTGKKHNFNTQNCRFWEVYAPNPANWNNELRENFKDAAEFEARVAANMLDVTIGDLPCAEGPDCKAPHFNKYNTKEKAVGCNMCTLCVARLAVEEELANER